MSNLTNGIILIVVATVITFLLRAFPFILFGDKREMPDSARRVVNMLPAAMMAVLVIYCIKNDIYSLHEAVLIGNANGLMGLAASVVAIICVVLVHLWKRQTLLSMAVGTVIYMILIRVM